MTFRRATLYLGVAAVAAAWLSSAAWSSMPQDPAAPIPSVAADDVPPPVLARSSRLRERMASAPRPTESPRNPFEFRTVKPAGSRAARASATQLSGDESSAAAAPPLSLIGIAAHEGPDGAVRTAVIATHAGELIMAGAGDVVLDRYTVVALASESVTLTDADTGQRTELRLDAQ